MWRFINFDVQGFGASAKQILGPAIRCDDIAGLDVLDAGEPASIDGVIVRLGVTLGSDVLSRLERLKVVATVTTGLDHIDQEYCAVHGIAVLSLKGETKFLGTITPTPEMTWCLLLALARKLPQAYAGVLEGEWERIPFIGHELNRKTLGIVGFGRVGKILGRYGHAFGMKVVVHDTRVAPPQGYPFTQASLDTVLTKADVVSIHLPLTTDTKHYFGREHFRRMRASAYFLNTARGALVDEAALLEALDSRWIAGAAVDVIEDEVVTGHVGPSHPLIAYARGHENMLISPHIAGSSFESIDRTSAFMARKIKRWTEAFAA